MGNGNIAGLSKCAGIITFGCTIGVWIFGGTGGGAGGGMLKFGSISIEDTSSSTIRCRVRDLSNESPFLGRPLELAGAGGGAGGNDGPMMLEIDETVSNVQSIGIPRSSCGGCGGMCVLGLSIIGASLPRFFGIASAPAPVIGFCRG